MVEYGIIIALFALAVVGGAALLFQGLQTAYVGASNDVGTPREPTQAPTNPAVPDPTDTEPEPTPTHTPVVAPTLTRTVICSTTPLDVNVRTALSPIQNATVLVASHPDADVRDSGRTIRYTADVPSDCGSTATIPYTFSYRENGIFYTDGTGTLEVTVLERAIADTQTLNVWCSPTAVATFDLSGTLSAWPGATVTGVSDNGRSTATITPPTTVAYDPDAEGGTTECGRTITIDYTFSYVIGGVTYTDGRGQLRVVVSGACNLNRQTRSLSGWSNTAFRAIVGDDGAATPTLDTSTGSGATLRYRYLRYTPTAADCGQDVRIDYTYLTRSGSSGPFATRSGSLVLQIRP
jgi:hypothetical protein